MPRKNKQIEIQKKINEEINNLMIKILKAASEKKYIFYSSYKGGVSCIGEKFENIEEIVILDEALEHLVKEEKLKQELTPSGGDRYKITFKGLEVFKNTYNLKCQGEKMRTIHKPFKIIIKDSQQSEKWAKEFSFNVVKEIFEINDNSNKIKREYILFKDIPDIKYSFNLEEDLEKIVGEEQINVLKEEIINIDREYTNGCSKTVYSTKDGKIILIVDGMDPFYTAIKEKFESEYICKFPSTVNSI